MNKAAQILDVIDNINFKMHTATSSLSPKSIAFKMDKEAAKSSLIHRPLLREVITRKVSISRSIDTILVDSISSFTPTNSTYLAYNVYKP